MTYQAEANAIRSRFNTEWGSTTPIAWPNKTFDPLKTEAGVARDPNPWVRLSILSAGSDQIEIAPTGSRTFRHDGTVAVQVFVPSNEGDGEARTLAEQVAAIFRGVTASGVTYLSPYVTEIGTENGWYGLTVWCPYYRDDQF